MKWLISAIAILFILLMLLATRVIGLERVVEQQIELAEAQSILNGQFIDLFGELVGGYEK